MMWAFYSGLALAVFGLLLIFLSVQDRIKENMAGAMAGIGFAAAIIGLLCLLICMLTAFNWHKAGVRAEVLNEQFGTKYTQRQMYYADDVIEQLREMQRQRMEINGNLFRDKPEQE